jgi:hypothetical protein
MAPGTMRSPVRILFIAPLDLSRSAGYTANVMKSYLYMSMVVVVEVDVQRAGP